MANEMTPEALAAMVASVKEGHKPWPDSAYCLCGKLAPCGAARLAEVVEGQAKNRETLVQAHLCFDDHGLPAGHIFDRINNTAEALSAALERQRVLRETLADLVYSVRSGGEKSFGFFVGYAAQIDREQIHRAAVVLGEPQALARAALAPAPEGR